MNTLKKLSISEDKIIKNEELVNLRGGWEYPDGTCSWRGSSEYRHVCNTTYEYVKYWVDNYYGEWCCDSCYSSEWWQNLCY